MTSALAALRARTRDAHARVDSAFGRYDLGNRAQYGLFLLAHARALPTVEAILAADAAVPPLRLRTLLLAADVAGLGQRMPVPLPFAGLTQAASVWGVLYVVEGSRLGGGVLARRVPAAWPTRYLQARHEPGEWSRLGQAINAEADRNGADWLEQAVLAADACFALYEQACLPG